MIELGYQIRDDSYMESYAVKPENLSKGNLLYDCFIGDIVLKNHTVNLNARWGWIPVVHFAIAMREIANDLEKHPSDQYQFTESEATIDFSKSGNIVQITASYASGMIEVSLSELVTISGKLVNDVILKLKNTYPGIKDNTALQELMKSGFGN